MKKAVKKAIRRSNLRRMQGLLEVMGWSKYFLNNYLAKMKEEKPRIR